MLLTIISRHNMASLSGTTYWNGPSATSQPGSLSHIRTKLFWVYLLRLILKEYKRQDRSHVTTDGRSVGRSVFASSPSWGARPDLCALNITARQSWGAAPDCSVSLSTAEVTVFFGCTHFLFSTLTLYTYPSSVQAPYTRLYLGLPSAFSNDIFVNWTV